MKWLRSSVILLVIVLIVTLSIEQVFALPVLMIMTMLVQQPVLGDLEACLLAGSIGILVAVVYHLPLAVGMAIFLLAICISRTVLQKAHVQARDAIVGLSICAALAIAMKVSITPLIVIGFIGYFLFVVVLMRVLISRRAFHAKRSFR